MRSSYARADWQLSPEKTVLTHLEDGFDFLGQNVRRFPKRTGAGTIVLRRPSKKNVKTFLAKVRTFLDDHQQAAVYWTITKLNPVIRGWANSHRYAASKETFVKVDTRICKALWAWAKRRHPNKGTRWVAAKYFGRTGLRNWRFFGEARDKDGQQIKNWLVIASDPPYADTRKSKAKLIRMTPPGKSILKKDLA